MNRSKLFAACSRITTRTVLKAPNSGSYRSLMPRRLYTSESPAAAAPNSTNSGPHPGQIRGALSQKKLLEATLPFVVSHGWTTETISLGAQKLGYPSIAHGLFPNGPADLIELFLEDCRLKLEKEMEHKKEAGELDNLGVTEIVRLAVITRLEMTRPYIKRWPEALAVMAHPTNSVMSFTQLGKLVDDIWYYAGDKSPDMNWYTKRATLAAVYTSTELYMTQDVSPNSVDTLGFLQRRLEQAELVGSGLKQLGTMLDFGARSVIGIVASRGNKI